MASGQNMRSTHDVYCVAPIMPPAVAPELLDEGHTDETLSFLAARPLRGLFLRGYIEDNGLASPLNRGDFFGVRNRAGSLEAVGLIGHATMFEASTDDSLAALASVAQQDDRMHMVLGPHNEVQRFWKHLSRDGRTPRGSCHELLFTRSEMTPVADQMAAMRRAKVADIDLLIPVHAEMARSESGVNPLDIDGDGFRRRYQRRIEAEQVWVVIENGQLVFKADVALQTSDAVYLEGVHVAPEARGQGRGRRCLSALTDHLLESVDSVCLLVNENNVAAHKMYRNAGFDFAGYYQSIFLQPRN
jgi:ribosomal protein S18 acetylase RimI-like enzyme